MYRKHARKFKVLLLGVTLLTQDHLRAVYREAAYEVLVPCHPSVSLGRRRHHHAGGVHLSTPRKVTLLIIIHQTLSPTIIVLRDGGGGHRAVSVPPGLTAAGVRQGVELDVGVAGGGAGEQV